MPKAFVISSEFLIYASLDGCIKVGQMWIPGYGLQSFRKGSDVCRIVILLYVLTTTGDGDSIEQTEEIEVEHPQKSLCGTLFWWKVCPNVIRALCLTEDVINAPIGG